jgi:hypothetical protein
MYLMANTIIVKEHLPILNYLKELGSGKAPVVSEIQENVLTLIRGEALTRFNAIAKPGIIWSPTKAVAQNTLVTKPVPRDVKKDKTDQEEKIKRAKREDETLPKQKPATPYSRTPYHESPYSKSPYQKGDKVPQTDYKVASSGDYTGNAGRQGSASVSTGAKDRVARRGDEHIGREREQQKRRDNENQQLKGLPPISNSRLRPQSLLGRVVQTQLTPEAIAFKRKEEQQEITPAGHLPPTYSPLGATYQVNTLAGLEGITKTTTTEDGLTAQGEYKPLRTGERTITGDRVKTALRGDKINTNIKGVYKESGDVDDIAGTSDGKLIQTAEQANDGNRGLNVLDALRTALTGGAGSTINKIAANNRFGLQLGFSETGTVLDTGMAMNEVAYLFEQGSQEHNIPKNTLFATGPVARPAFATTEAKCVRYLQQD